MPTTTPNLALSNNVQAVLRRAQAMVADGHNSTSEVASLIGDIGRLPDADRTQLFDAFEQVKKQSGAPNNREAVDVVLHALRDKPAQLLAGLEADDGIIDMKDALAALAQVGSNPNAKVSVFTAMLFQKATPDAREALLNFATGTPPSIEKQFDSFFRGRWAQNGSIKPDEIDALTSQVKSDNERACYVLNYWAMVTPAAFFAPGAQEKLRAAAESKYPHVGFVDKCDLELNRNNGPSLRGAEVLDLYSRELLKLPFKVSFVPGAYSVEVNGKPQTYSRPDDLCAFLIETALKAAGHAVDSVRYQPQASGGVYVMKKGAATEQFNFEAYLIRQFGYRR